MITVPGPKPGPERRLRRLWLDPHDILDFFLANPLDCAAVALPRAVGLPKGTRVHSIWAEEAPCTFGVLVEHPSFDPVPPGEAPPRVELHMEYVRVHRLKDEHGSYLAQPGTAAERVARLQERFSPNAFSSIWNAVRETMLSYGQACRQEVVRANNEAARHLDDASKLATEAAQRLSALSDECDRLTAERDQLRGAITEHHRQKADDRCIEDDDKLYAAAGLPPVDRRVGDKFAMLQNCPRFIERRCEGGHWPSYRELEEQVATLLAQLAEERERCKRIVLGDTDRNDFPYCGDVRDLAASIEAGCNA